MIFTFDPIFIVSGILSYIFLLLVANVIASRIVSNRVLSKLSLWASMILTSIMIIVLLSLSIYVFIIVSDRYSTTEIGIAISQIIFLVIATNIVTYLLGPRIINTAYNIKFDNSLNSLVEEVKNRLGYRGRMKIGVFEGIPNAFAYGNFLFGKYIAVSRSLIESMDEDELKSVIGHELGHHKHKDNIIMLLFGVVPSIIYYMGYSLLYSSLSDNEEKSPTPLILVGILLILISAIVQILVLAFSRLREYYADVEGALASSKDSMQRALTKIHLMYATNPTLQSYIRKSSLKTLFIYAITNSIAKPYVEISREMIESLKKEKYDPIHEILSTHPPIPKRLKNLDRLK